MQIFSLTRSQIISVLPKQTVFPLSLPSSNPFQVFIPHLSTPGLHLCSVHKVSLFILSSQSICSSWNIQKARLSSDCFSCKEPCVLEAAVTEITLEIFSANVCSLLPSFYLKEEHGLCISLVQ